MNSLIAPPVCSTQEFPCAFVLLCCPYSWQFLFYLSRNVLTLKIHFLLHGLKFLFYRILDVLDCHRVSSHLQFLCRCLCFGNDDPQDQIQGNTEAAGKNQCSKNHPPDQRIPVEICSESGAHPSDNSSVRVTVNASL